MPRRGPRVVPRTQTTDGRQLLPPPLPLGTEAGIYGGPAMFNQLVSRRGSTSRGEPLKILMPRPHPPGPRFGVSRCGLGIRAVTGRSATDMISSQLHSNNEVAGLTDKEADPQGVSHLPRVNQACKQQSQNSNPDSANHRAGAAQHLPLWPSGMQPTFSPLFNVRLLPRDPGLRGGQGPVSARLPDPSFQPRAWHGVGSR